MNFSAASVNFFFLGGGGGGGGGNNKLELRGHSLHSEDLSRIDFIRAEDIKEMSTENTAGQLQLEM